MAKKILIVEDESSARKAMEEKFQREGFEVFTAIDGIRGLAEAQRLHPEIILLDIIMPNMDGIMMLKKLREDGGYGKQVPVILLTNLSSDDDGRRKEIDALSPVAYMVKTDWKLSDVVEKVNQCLEGKC
ncbi:MAG: response regulator [Candidatus Parcubacteria bacterium]|nr:response regulator [Candidatus Parcubacteria bacterium]